MKRLTKIFMLLIAALLIPAAESAAQTSMRSSSTAREVEMLTRAERRVDALQSQLLDLQMKEFQLRASIESLDYQMRSDNINRALQFVGSPRPMDEFRDELRRWLEKEKERVNDQLELLTATRTRVESALRDAEAECNRLRKLLRLCSDTNACEEGGQLSTRDGDSSANDSREVNQ